MVGGRFRGTVEGCRFHDYGIASFLEGGECLVLQFMLLFVSSGCRFSEVRSIVGRGVEAKSFQLFRMAGFNEEERTSGRERQAGFVGTV